MSNDIEDRPIDDQRLTIGERLNTPAGQLVKKVTLVIVVMTVILVIFSVWWVNESMPVVASDTEQAVQDTMMVFAVASAPVMALVWGIGYYSLRHWRSPTKDLSLPPEDGPPIRSNARLTMTWVIVSGILTAFLLVWGLTELTATTTIPTTSSPLVVKVTGQQWLWSFAYDNDGGVGSPDLVLPIDRTIVFQVTSTDVIHSFWLPEMGVKVDANPGVMTTSITTPSKLGTFNVRCAELCGLNHSFMETTVTVVSADDFNKWITAHGGTPGQKVAGGTNG